MSATGGKRQIFPLSTKKGVSTSAGSKHVRKEMVHVTVWMTPNRAFSS